MPFAAGAIQVQSSPMPDAPSLYERLGGEPAIEALVDNFYKRVMDDPDLLPIFRNTPIDRLRTMQREFFAMALGGPIAYTGRPLSHVHHGRGITTYHFSRFVEHLVETLIDNGISDAEGEEVIDRINSYSNEITGASY